MVSIGDRNSTLEATGAATAPASERSRKAAAVHYSIT
jgi:hypothetical protein